MRRPQGYVVGCRQGSLWITFDGVLEDVVLDAGQRHVAVQPSRMPVHALGDRALQLVAGGGVR